MPWLSAVILPSISVFIDLVKSLSPGPTPVHTPPSQSPKSSPIEPFSALIFKSALSVVLISVEDDLIVERMVGRRGCPKCGQMYHIKYNPPKEDGVCGVCGEALVQRKDDTEEIAKNRFDTYFKQTAPLIDFYEKRGNLVKIDATGTVEEIYTKLKEVIR